VNSSSTCAPSSPRPHSVDAPYNKINTQEHTETTGSRPEELRDASRHGTPAQGLEDWEQQGTQAVGETPREDDLMDNGDGVDMQQQEEVRGKWLIKEDDDSQKKKKKPCGTYCLWNTPQVESSTYSSSHAQSKIDLEYLAAPINNELGGVGEKRERKDTYREISCESQHSVNSDDTCDTGDEDPRPAKRRKPCVAPALIAPLHVRSSRFPVPPLTTHPRD
jgi:hypothetical protein